MRWKTRSSTELTRKREHKFYLKLSKLLALSAKTTKSEILTAAMQEIVLLRKLNQQFLSSKASDNFCKKIP